MFPKMSAYIPPFRRRQAEGASPSEPSSADLPPDHSSRGHNQNRGSGRGSRGGGFDGGSRGRRVDGSRIDGTNSYHRLDIMEHFRPSPDPRGGATLRDSINHPHQLSFVQLFYNANLLWASERIIFAKSNLQFLPGYGAAVLEHGPWDPYPDGVPVRSSDAPKNSVFEEETDEITAADAGEATSTEATEDTVHSTTASIGKEAANGQDENILSAQGTRETKADEEIGDYKETASHLPSIEPIEYTPPDHPAIALFEECRKQGDSLWERNGRFIFVGWYKVGHVELVSPRSKELVQMLKRKWEWRNHLGNLVPIRNRSAAAWEEALTSEWAIVKFKALDASEAPPPPAIKKLHSEAAELMGAVEPKSVNEMLAEMRLKDRAKKATTRAEGEDGAGQAETSGNQEGTEAEVEDEAGGEGRGTTPPSA